MRQNDPARIVTDSEADASISSLKIGTVIPVKTTSTTPTADPPLGQVHLTNQDAPKLSDAQMRFLRAVVQFPMRSSSEYPKLANLSPNSCKIIRSEMVERGYIREHKVDLSPGRGRPHIKLEPLESARKLVADMPEK